MSKKPLHTSLTERVERLVDISTKITQDADGSPQEAIFSLMAAAVTIAFENDDEPDNDHDDRLHGLLDIVLQQMGTSYASANGI